MSDEKGLVSLLTAICMMTAAVTPGVMLGTCIPQSKYKQGMLFAVTLPAHAMEHAEIGRIRARFNKQMIQYGILMAALLIPLVLLHKWAAYDTLALKRANETVSRHSAAENLDERLDALFRSALQEVWGSWKRITGV